MNTVTQYIQKFMAESAKLPVDPIAVELDKIRDMIDLDGGSEFSIHIELSDEVPSSIDPRTGALVTSNIEEDQDGVLSIEEENGIWSWSAVIPNALGDLGGSGSNFDSLESCLASVHDYAYGFDTFEVLGLA